MRVQGSHHVVNPCALLRSKAPLCAQTNPPPPPPPLSLFPTRILDLTKIGSMTTEMDLGAPLALVLGLGVRQARLLALLL